MNLMQLANILSLYSNTDEIEIINLENYIVLNTRHNDNNNIYWSSVNKNKGAYVLARLRINWRRFRRICANFIYITRLNLNYISFLKFHYFNNK